MARPSERPIRLTFRVEQNANKKNETIDKQHSHSHNEYRRYSLLSKAKSAKKMSEEEMLRFAAVFVFVSEK